MPMVRGVDALSQRCGVQDQVVRRAIQPGEATQDLVERLSRGGEVGIRGHREVGGVAARDHPNLERRARRERREGHAGLVLPDQPRPVLRLLAGEPAIRTLTLADHVASGSADLLGNSVRYLWQVVQVETKVISTSAGLGS